MNTKTAKKESDVVLAGVTVEFTRVDDAIKGVILRDGVGSYVEFRSGDWGGFVVLVPSPPPMVDRWQIKGELRGLAFCETFEHEHEALSRLIVLFDGGDEHGIKPEKVSVPQ